MSIPASSILTGELLFPDDGLAVLQKASYDPAAERGFEGLSRSFFWSDELLRNFMRVCRNHGSMAHRFVMEYRSSLMLGGAIEEYLPVWEQLQNACPAWPGFRPERCSSDLARDLKRAWKRQCLDFERLLRDGKQDGQAVEPTRREQE